jgi:uncharacterized protein (TIGR00730 family)
MKTVCVFGGYRPRRGEREYELAHELGRRIAESGWTLLNGGYGGTMEAGARGAREAGGRVVGVTLAVFRKGHNELSHEIHHAADLWQRIQWMIDKSDAYIALPGNTGTLAEVGMAWESVFKEFVRPRPVILLTEFWRPLYEMMAGPHGGKAACGGLVRVEADAESAVRYLSDYWKGQ